MILAVVMPLAKPMFPWVGGKEKLIPYVKQILPTDMKIYVEPFGGSGAMLLALPPDLGRLDIYNDLDSELSNFFLCVRERPLALMRELDFCFLHSRVIFDALKNFLEQKESYQQFAEEELECLNDRSMFTEEQARNLWPILQERKKLFDVKRAAAFYYSVRGSFSGTRSSFGVKSCDPGRFLHLISLASKRLKDVVVENKPANRLIYERDGPDTCFYLDPPYWSTEKAYLVVNKKSRQYHFHVRLWQMVQKCVGRVILSYNDCEEIRKLYHDNFYILAFQRGNPLAKQKDAEFGELLITNYDPRPYMQGQVTLFDAAEDKYDMELVNIPKHPIKQ